MKVLNDSEFLVWSWLCFSVSQTSVLMGRLDSPTPTQSFVNFSKA